VFNKQGWPDSGRVALLALSVGPPTMISLKKSLVYLVAFLLFIFFLVIVSTMPIVEGEIYVDKIENKISIKRDKNGVPSISASGPLDVYFGLGFAHAQDRLWQIDFRRRLVKGELAEIYGERFLKTDMFMRTLGLHKAAEKSYANLDDSTRKLLIAYSQGVNVAAKQGQVLRPPEFLLLGTEFEEWRPEDSIALLKIMAFNLGKNWKKEVKRLNLSALIGSQMVSEFFPPYPGDLEHFIPEVADLYDLSSEHIMELLNIHGESNIYGPGASNNWVIPPSKSVSGSALLANDPHLTLENPSTWYFVHLKAPNINIAGATLAGMPGVMFGMTDKISWGLTNNRADVQDLFLEKHSDLDSDYYISGEGPKKFNVRYEEIAVKGLKDKVRIEVRESSHGPVISDRLKRFNKDKRYSLALSWVGFDEIDPTIRSILNLPYANNWDDFVRILEDFHAPMQNIVYADVEGNVGFHLPGKVPIRSKDNLILGGMPVPGWDHKYDWQGYVPYDALPSKPPTLNEVIFTANNKVVNEDFPYFISREWRLPYRANRIEELLNKEKYDLESMSDIQLDTVSLMVSDLYSIMIPSVLDLKESKELIESSLPRNFDLDKDESSPLLFAAWLRELSRLIYYDELGEMFEEYFEVRPLFLKNVLTNQNGMSSWCHDSVQNIKHSCEELIRKAFLVAYSENISKYGEDASKRNWGVAHEVNVKHPVFSKLPLIGDIFSFTAPTGGDGYSINVGRHDISNEDVPFQNFHAANPRILVEMSEKPILKFSYLGGQSGHPLSRYYYSFIKKWSDGEYVELRLDHADFDSHLTLIPAKLN
jgi:penicillin amidase